MHVEGPADLWLKAKQAILKFYGKRQNNFNEIVEALLPDVSYDNLDGSPPWYSACKCVTLIFSRCSMSYRESLSLLCESATSGQEVWGFLRLHPEWFFLTFWMVEERCIQLWEFWFQSSIKAHAISTSYLRLQNNCVTHHCPYRTRPLWHMDIIWRRKIEHIQI